MFRAVKPDTWVFRELADDYGIDGQVEIFEGDSATGLVFNVQLKSSSSSLRRTVRLKRSTINYWRSLETPTLVVLVDANEDVWIQWAHMLDLYGRSATAITHTFELQSMWTGLTVAEIQSEVRAARATKDLRYNLPVSWSLSISEIEGRAWRSEFIVMLETSLHETPELVRPGNDRSETQLEVNISRRLIGVRLRGRAGGYMHYPQDVAEQPVSRLVADVVTAIAFELGRRGLDLVALRLFRSWALDGSFIGVAPELTIYATKCLCEAGEVGVIVQLLEKVYLEQSRPVGFLILTTIVEEKGRLDGPQIKQVAERLRLEAERKIGEEGSGELFYNAGNLISHVSPEVALELYERAASEEPKYLRRGYWWREKGAIHFETEDYDAAIDSYSEAVAVGDVAALPLLADSQCHAGHFADAVSNWHLVENVDRLSWVLKAIAVEGLIEVLGMGHQVREPERARVMFEAGAPPSEVLTLDAINPWALWKLAALSRDSQPVRAMQYQLAAACFARTVPVTWFEAFMDANHPASVDHFGPWLRTAVLSAAVQEAGPSFRHFIIQDEFVSDEIRDALLEAIDAVAPLVDEPEFRFGDDVS